MKIRETSWTWLLAALLLAVAQGSVAGQSSVVLRRVLIGPEINSYYFTPSPDGHFVSYVDWSDGNLVIRDLATDEIRHVTDKGSWAESSTFAETSAWSSDGTCIAYAFWGGAGYELRRTNVDGSDTRVLASNLGYLRVHDWSPDGEHVLAAMYPMAGDGYLGLISAESGEERRFDVPFELDGRIEFSPDGRYLAYSAPANLEGHRTGWSPDSGAERDLYALELETGDLRKLLGGPGHELMMGWGGDGSRIYLYSDRSGSPSIWAVPVSDGRAAGPPELLRRDVEGVVPNGSGGEGFFYTVVVETPQTHTMVLDVESGRVLASPTAERGPSDGRTGSAAWSPDGRFLAYVHTPPSVGPSDRANLVIRSVSGDNLRTLPLPFIENNLGWLRWDADSRSLLLMEHGEGTMRVLLESGESEAIPGPWNGPAALSPDGRTIFSSGNPDKPDEPGDFAGQEGIFAYDVNSGDARLMLELGPPSQGGQVFGFPQGLQQILTDISVSPDGETLALGFRGGIVLAPASGGKPEVLHRREAGHLRGRGRLPWTPDGTHILFTVNYMSDPPRPDELWAVSVDSGEARRLLSFDNLRNVRLHPDGRRLAFTGGSTLAELWIMEPEHGKH
jgi:Tol biopolymer transport system component